MEGSSWMRYDDGARKATPWSGGKKRKRISRLISHKSAMPFVFL
jgi:hypothetical protein